MNFWKLDEGYEPTASDILQEIENQFSIDASSKGSMGEMDGGIVFAGYGEPLLRSEILFEVVDAFKSVRNGIPFRINTNGLILPETVLASSLIHRGDSDSRRDTRIDTISVNIGAQNPDIYKKVMQPQGSLGFRDVCNFISTLSEAGMNVECTVSENPMVDINATRELAFALGARTFRTRTYWA